MNKKPHRRRGLRFNMILMPVLVAVMMAILCASILALEHISVTRLSDSLSINNHYIQFNIAFTQFRETFNRYVNSLEHNALVRCRDQLARIDKYAAEMAADFPGEEAVEHTVELARAFTEHARLTLEGGTTLTGTEFWNHVAQAGQEMAAIDSAAYAAQLVYLENIAEQSDQSVAYWDNQMQLCVFSALLVLLVLAFSIDEIIQKTVSPILQLVYYAKRMAAGNFDDAIEAPDEKQTDELAQLSTAFASMAVTIQRQMRELQDKIALTDQMHQLEVQNMQIRLALAEKEMTLMQSMVNPHFLFNCLGTVSSAAVLENAPRTQAISTQIARYLRNCMELAGERISLRAEVQLLKQYIDIQSLRFGERITAAVNCDPACEQATVPAMFLQPLVENNYVHGLRNCEDGGRITVDIAAHADSAIDIDITDNGCGIACEALASLRAFIRNPRPGGESFRGIRSVISFLDTMFKDSYTFEIESTAGVGSVIHIRIPRVEQKPPSTRERA